MKLEFDYMMQRGGIWYYYRRTDTKVLPLVHRKFYRQSLQTKDKNEAIKRAIKVNAKVEAEWSSLLKAAGITTETRATIEDAIAFLRVHGLAPGDGSKDLGGITGHELFEAHVLEPTYGTSWLEARYAGYDDPYLSDEERHHIVDGAVAQLLNPIHRTALDLLHTTDKPPIFLSAARDLYIAHSDKGSRPDFLKQHNVAIDSFVSLFGDIPLVLIERKHALAYRDNLLAKGNKTATVRKRLGAISRIFKTANIEHGLKLDNPFADMKIPKEKADVTKRDSFTDAQLELMAAACRSQSSNESTNERFRILAMLLNTGARLSEILGLLCSDVVLDHEVPHIIIHEDERELKTAASTRVVPLVGIALWAAQEQQKIKPMGRWFFPVYATDNGGIKSNTADQTLNKYVKAATKTKLTCHCFRHTMADRIREITEEEAVLLAIGGWGRKTIARSYGNGFLVEKLAPIMRQLKGY
jgi:integrase